LTPYTLAFPETYTEDLYFFDIAMNIIFILDMVVNFVSAYYDGEMHVVDDHKVLSSIFYSLYR
jgi:hypothetical protein